MPLHGQHAAGAAMRRRQRRLRSWLRHERMTVAMTLAEMTHHTAPRGPMMARVRAVEEQVSHAGLRAQKTPPPGERPGILPEPLPQRSDRSRRHFSGDTHPTSGLPVLAGASGEVVDSSALAFLTRQTLLARAREKSEEEALAKKEEEKQEDETRLEIRSLLSVPWERRTAVQRSRLRALLQLRVEASSSSKRKMKKKRRKKLPKAAVRSSSGTSSSFVPAVRARDVFCARHVRDVPGCLSLFDAFAVLPSFVGRALLLGNMDGMDQDYSLTSSFLAVAYARLVLLLFLAQCSCSLSSGPRCSTSWPVRIRSTVTCFSCARLVLLVTVHPELCCLPCLLARDARHHGRYGPEGQLPRGVHNTVFFWEMFLCFCVQRNAWTSCYMLCVSIRMLLEEFPTFSR